MVFQPFRQDEEFNNELAMITTATTTDDTFHRFKLFPYDVRYLIWTFTIVGRYIEVVFQNKGGTSDEHDEHDDHGAAYFKNPKYIRKMLPSSIWACHESLHILLPYYPILDLGEYNIINPRDIEYVWVPRENMEMTDKKGKLRAIRFNPRLDTMVLEAGYALHRKTVFFKELPVRAVELSGLDKTVKNIVQTEKSTAPNAPVQRLATSMFPWDGKDGLPKCQKMLVEAFPDLKTLDVIGQPSDRCACGYCHPPVEHNPKEVKEKVIETLKTVIDEGMSFPQVRAVEMINDAESDRPWFGNAKMDWDMCDVPQHP